MPALRPRAEAPLFALTTTRAPDWPGMAATSRTPASESLLAHVCNQELVPQSAAQRASIRGNNTENQRVRDGGNARHSGDDGPPKSNEVAQTRVNCERH